MAQPIVRTPDLEGKDAKRFIKMHENLTLTKERSAFLENCVKVYKSHKAKC